MFSVAALSQSTSIVPIRGDTIRIYKQGGNAELKLENSTKDSTGVLVNIGGGRTSFIKGRALNDSTILIGLDTIVVRGAGGSGSGNENANIGAGFRVLNAATQEMRTFFGALGANIDTTSNSGGITLKTTSPVYGSVADMRNTPSPHLDTSVIYFRNTGRIFVPYKWNPNSTTTDDSVTFIERTGTTTGRFELYFEEQILVDWFGATPGDGIDDSYAIQKAIDFAVRSNKGAVVQCLGGTYNIKNLVIGKKSGNEYDFVTLTLRGNANLVNNATIFSVDDPDAFGINIQRGRLVSIENISFFGAGPAITDLKEMVENSAANWAGVINNRYSQHNAINIDAFSTYVTDSLRYPGVSSSYYSNTVRGGTSMVTIRRCSFISFVNGVIESPGGWMQNGDNVLVSDCYFQTNKNCFSSGQNQSRANKLVGCYLIFNETIVNGNDYGLYQGTVADIINCNIAGGTAYLYKVNGPFSGVNIMNSYTESLFSLGVAGDMPVTVTNSQIVMMRDDVDNTFISPVIAEGRKLTFVGGSLEYFDNISATPFVFNISGDISFHGTKIRGGVPLNNYYGMGKVKFNGVDFTTVDGSSRLDEGAQTPYDDISLVMYKHVIPGLKMKLLQGVTAEAENDKIERTYLEAATLRVNSTTHTAYFITTQPGRYRVYDALAEIGAAVSNDYAGDQFSGTQGLLGVVSQISGDTVKLRYVPYGLTDNTVHSVSLVRIPKFIPRIIGDIENGSDTIRNVQTYGASIEVGVRVKGAGIPAGAYVTYVGTGKFKISIPATATSTTAPIYDAKVRFTSSNATAAYPSASLPIIHPGDYIDAEFSNTAAASDSIARWYCIKAGVVGGSPAPVFRGLKLNTQGATQDLDDVLGEGGALTADRTTNLGGYKWLFSNGDLALNNQRLYADNGGNGTYLVKYALDHGISFFAGFSQSMFYTTDRVQLERKLNLYDATGGNSVDLTIRQNSTAIVTQFQPLSADANNTKYYRYNTRETITAPSAFLQSYENNGTVLAFQRPNGLFKYNFTNINSIADDSTLINQHRAKVVLSDSLNVLRNSLDSVVTLSLTTTNTTPATMPLSIPQGYKCKVEVLMMAENEANNEVLMGEKWIGVKNVGGTFTIVRSLYTAMPDGTSETNSLSGLSWTLTLSGGSPVIEVTGLTGVNIKWTATKQMTCDLLTEL